MPFRFGGDAVHVYLTINIWISTSATFRLVCGVYSRKLAVRPRFCRRSVQATSAPPRSNAARVRSFARRQGIWASRRQACATRSCVARSTRGSGVPARPRTSSGDFTADGRLTPACGAGDVAMASALMREQHDLLAFGQGKMGIPAHGILPTSGCRKQTPSYREPMGPFHS